MTIQGSTICSLIQSFPVLLILAQGHNRCLETPFIYKPPSPTQSPEYYQALDALFQSIYGHEDPTHGHGYPSHGHYPSHEYPHHHYPGTHDHHQPCYTYAKKYGTKPCYPTHSYTPMPSYGTTYGHHGTSYGNHGTSYGNHGTSYSNHGTSYGNHGTSYGKHVYAYVPTKKGSIYDGNVTHGSGYASSQGYTVNNRYKVVVKKTRIGGKRKRTGKLLADYFKY